MTSKALFFTRFSLNLLHERCHINNQLRTSSTKASSNARCSLHRDLQVSSSSLLHAISEVFLFELKHCMLLKCKYYRLAILAIVPFDCLGDYWSMETLQKLTPFEFLILPTRPKQTKRNQGIFELFLDMHAPLKNKRVRDNCAPWLNQSIRDLM